MKIDNSSEDYPVGRMVEHYDIEREKEMLEEIEKKEEMKETLKDKIRDDAEEGLEEAIGKINGIQMKKDELINLLKRMKAEPDYISNLEIARAMREALKEDADQIAKEILLRN